MLNLSMILEDSAWQYPDRDALVLDPHRYSYAETNALANRVANLLVDRGVEPGDRVALSCPNLPWFPIVYYGILKAGAVVVPMNILLKGQEVEYHLRDSDAKAYFCFQGSDDLPIGEYAREGFERTPGCSHLFVMDQDAPVLTDDSSVFAALLASKSPEFEAVARETDDAAVILYTSGTTGKSKGAELTHSNMVMNAVAASRQFDFRPDRGDTHLSVLPLFHSFGQTANMNGGLSTGATIVLQPRFDAPAALALMARERVTVFAGVPTMYWSLLSALDENVDVKRLEDNLRVAISGGAALPVEILTQFRKRFGVKILEAYGLSETSPLALCNSLEPDGSRPGSIGKPMWGVQVRLVDEQWNTVDAANVVAEIAIRGHNIMKGYRNRREATAEVLQDGWFRTGDLARRDDDGFYYIVDRAKDLIIRGGFNVYPREVEEALMTHHAVSLATVVGVPHASHGEEIKAFVIPEPGVNVTEEQLVAWAKDQMAAYKYPRKIEFVDSLPMTATGKILKRELR
ncbi:long-chain-fatty-acid--CoA ligase [Rhodococcus tukisamuensis]|uniref:Long-chain acyl-CoA synthetase n=1 Tax=Rhodococcus tukisamuensis TaxID=168276 RepID=A0A1G6T4Q6_9NOCA|nr:long-chain fatty acid--CoA ligase [Rhodococcus tukisamuensis]SDD24140.1 long-chain acyl-CoA synthetase [Rhodococcus tukisamuensis]